MGSPPNTATASVTAETAAAIAERHYGLAGEVVALPGEQDQNFRITTSDASYVLKFHPPDTRRGVLDLQNAALEHIAASHGSVLVPSVVPAKDGDDIAQITLDDGSTRLVRVLTWIPGEVWADVPRRDPLMFASLGTCVARVDEMLVDFQHREMHREYLWGMQHAGRLREFLPLIADVERRHAAREILTHFVHDVAPRLATCRAQVIHNDASDRNILVGPEGDVVGLIDFGDLIYAPAVSGLAVACAYAMLGLARPVTATLPLVASYHQVTPLTDLELELLFDLVRTRLAMSLCMAAWQSHESPKNDYLKISQEAVWELLQRLKTENHHLVRLRIRDACGRAADQTARTVVRWIETHSEHFANVCRHDLKSAPRLFFDLSREGEDSKALEQLSGVAAATDYVFNRLREEEAAAGIGRYLEDRSWYRASHFAMPDSDERRSVHLGVDLFLGIGEPIYAPLDGVIHAFANNAREGDYGPVIMLEHQPADGIRFWTLYGHLSLDSLDGLEVGQQVARGQEIGRIGEYSVNGDWVPHLHFQLLTNTLDLGCDIDGVVAPSMLDVWECISPDPNLVLGIPEGCRASPRRDRNYLLRERRRYLSDSLSLSYDEPLHIVRAAGQFLYDANGRAYLDMVNNVCHVGHCHPRVVRAGQDQMARLNTNTRYLYDPLVEYVHRLLATFPEQLSVCFLVNSGSEANDLALRLARAHTGADGVVVIDHAYHGHLSSLIEISPYKFRGPGGLGCPQHVRVCEMPDGYRGPVRTTQPDYARVYARDVQHQIDSLEQNGYGLAAFFAESAMSCGGQIILPPGYLQEAYALVRQAGGVCVADEVQVGLGRVGTHMWAFETQGVVPDIVTLGKPLGNGHPLAAVITTRQIAATFETGMEYFNTFGGNPVSAAIGLAVLDVMRDERLQQNALSTGHRLMSGLKDLATRHSLIGDVRGLGLFIGVELVRDVQTLEPADREATAVIEGAKQRGVLLSIDGPHRNVLKIKPPMAMTGEHVDRFLEVLEEVFEGVGSGE